MVLALDPQDSGAATRALREHGLLLAPWPRKSAGPPCLWVANKHPRLEQAYRATAWAGGRWREDLRRLPNSFEPADSHWIGDGKARCVVIAGAHLPPAEGA
ncbi:hypothetical protein [Teichococcus vastitatis]|uniref:Uncharacterized protein n=1 Tax=Teichococcus vastitatis TaxID=2307076 RepID=A0ABS9W8X1_9PROT|nr:hypothetical protein [Pseudoroseomonas vastitatis]MCI0755746.1 hypothetical protein [Pseudoroseomonas vastitatis]